MVKWRDGTWQETFCGRGLNNDILRYIFTPGRLFFDRSTNLFLVSPITSWGTDSINGVDVLNSASTESDHLKYDTWYYLNKVEGSNSTVTIVLGCRIYDFDIDINEENSNINIRYCFTLDPTSRKYSNLWKVTQKNEIVYLDFHSTKNQNNYGNGVIYNESSSKNFKISEFYKWHTQIQCLILGTCSLKGSQGYSKFFLHEKLTGVVIIENLNSGY